MRLETFFEKFDQFADAPDAIGTLREVILQLAVSGRLVSQSRTDAPVDVGRLDEQAAPRKQAEGRSGASLDAVIEDEIAEEIPDSWVWARLFRLCEPDAPIVYGILQPGPDVRPNGVPYVRPTEIKDGQIRLAEIRHTSPEIAAQYTRATIRKGDVLLTIVGTLGATAVVPEELDGGNITQSSCRLRPNSRFIDTSYLVICLRSRTLLNQYRGFSLGSAVQRLNIAHVRALAIPLPPLAEQKRIVAKVDELMALCDRLEAQQQEREMRHSALARASLARFADAPTPANLELLFHSSYAIPPADLRKSILTLAVQGKLVPQDPSDEPAHETLRRCKVDTKKCEVAPNEERQVVPESWTWIRFSGVGEQRLGKMLDAQKNRGELKPYLRNTNVQWMRFELDDVKDMRVEEREVEELRLKAGDLLICEGGEPGRCAIWRDEVGEMYFQKAIHRVRPCEAVMSEYLALNLQIDCANGVLAGYFTGATIKHLTGRSLAAYPVPLPPLAEQRRIVAKVEQLMALVDALEKQLAASRATAGKLLSALVAELTAA